MRKLLFLALVFCCLPVLAFGQKVYTLADTVIANRLIQESSDIIYGNQNHDDSFDLGYNKIDSALLMSEQIWGQESKETGHVLGIKIDYLIFIYKKYDEALIMAEKILAIRLKAFGEIYPTTAHAYANFGNCYAGKFMSEKAIAAYTKEIEILEKIQPLDEERIAAITCAIAGVYAETDEFVKTCFYYEKAEKIYAKILGETDPLTLHISIHLAKYYNDNFEYDKASQKLNVMQQRIQKLSGTEKLGAELDVSMQHLNIAYNTGNLDKAFHYLTLIENGRQQLNLGQSHLYSLYAFFYAEKGDFDKALNYAYKNLDVALKQSYLFPKLEAYSALAEIYFLKEDYSNGLKYCQIGLDSSKSITEFTHSRIADFSHELARYLPKKERYDESIALCQTLLAQYKEQHNRTTYKDYDIYYILGDAYTGKRLYDSALHCYNKALTLYKEVSSRDNFPDSEIEQKIVAVLETQKDFSTAYTYFSKTLKSQNYYKGQDLNKVFLLYVVIDLLEAKATFERRWYLATGDKKHLETSAATYQEAFEVLNYYNRLFNVGTTKTRQRNKRYALYEGRIQILVHLSDTENLQKAFIVNESNKASSLQSQIKESNALQFANIPKSLLEREKDLRFAITTLEKEKQDRLNKEKNDIDSLNLSLSIRIDSLRALYANLKKQFEKNYPDYYRLKYDLKTVSVADIQQKMLKPEQTLLSYFVGDSSIFAFLIKKDTFIVLETKKDFPLEAWVKQLRTGIYGYYTDAKKPEKLYETTADSFAVAAYLLHQKLITPLSNLLTKEVIIVPDGVLGYVPFDVLLSEKPKEATEFKKHNYFGKDHIISYNYSATLWQEMRNKKHKTQPQKPFIGFAPYFNGDSKLLDSLFSYDIALRKGLDSLKNSGEEVYRATKLMGGEAILNKDATKQKFEQIVGNYRIVHLATHGKANDKIGDYCFLAFTEQKDSLDKGLLYVRDIYNLSLNADLVVLSACETGIGELKRGEGIVSLSRAFAYAGAKSMVTTLWSVNDKSTMQIMEGFYHQLKKGKTKDYALWKAKQDYLEKVKDKDMAHPYFWSAFIPIGDMRTIKN